MRDTSPPFHYSYPPQFSGSQPGLRGASLFLITVALEPRQPETTSEQRSAFAQSFLHGLEDVGLRVVDELRSADKFPLDEGYVSLSAHNKRVITSYLGYYRGGREDLYAAILRRYTAPPETPILRVHDISVLCLQAAR